MSQDMTDGYAITVGVESLREAHTPQAVMYIYLFNGVTS